MFTYRVRARCAEEIARLDVPRHCLVREGCDLNGDIAAELVVLQEVNSVHTRETPKLTGDAAREAVHVEVEIDQAREETDLAWDRSCEILVDQIQLNHLCSFTHEACPECAWGARVTGPHPPKPVVLPRRSFRGLVERRERNERGLEKEITTIFDVMMGKKRMKKGK